MSNRVLILTLAAAPLSLAAAFAQVGPPGTPARPAADLVKRGEYLVTIGLCHDCHTPLVEGPDGPAPDIKRALSGHPQEIAVQGAANPSPPWVGAMTGTLTAWSGAWGVSFSANLTPDPETGVLRDFTEEQFIQTLRTGRHQGRGRQILPPMPWPLIGKMTDDDLKAVFAYLRQIPAVRNKVPDPIPPTQ